MAISSSINSSSIVEVLDRILDKGIVIDIFARITIVGIEIITIEARIVIASIEKYLIYVNSINKFNNSKLSTKGKEVLLWVWRI